MPSILRPRSSLISSQPSHTAICPQRHRATLQGGAHGTDIGITLGQHLTGESITGLATDTASALSQVDSHRIGKGVQSLCRQPLMQRLDGRLMRHGRKGIWCRARWLGWIFTRLSMYPIKGFGACQSTSIYASTSISRQWRQWHHLCRFGHGSFRKKFDMSIRKTHTKPFGIRDSGFG